MVFDARGHFHEPHSEEIIPLGTLEVRDYLSRVERHQVDDVDFNIWEDRYSVAWSVDRLGRSAGHVPIS